VWPAGEMPQFHGPMLSRYFQRVTITSSVKDRIFVYNRKVKTAKIS
jgi:hypothetical protein